MTDKQPDPMREYVEEFAKKCGWNPGDSEGAFECVQRTSYAQGVEDGRAARHDRIAELEAENSLLRVDAARLDWLERNLTCSLELHSGAILELHNHSLKFVLDAAMKQEKTK